MYKSVVFGILENLLFVAYSVEVEPKDFPKVYELNVWSSIFWPQIWKLNRYLNWATATEKGYLQNQYQQVIIQE